MGGGIADGAWDWLTCECYAELSRLTPDGSQLAWNPCGRFLEITGDQAFCVGGEGIGRDRDRYSDALDEVFAEVA